MLSTFDWCLQHLLFESILVVEYCWRTHRSVEWIGWLNWINRLICPAPSSLMTLFTWPSKFVDFITPRCKFLSVLWPIRASPKALHARFNVSKWLCCCSKCSRMIRPLLTVRPFASNETCFKLWLTFSALNKVSQSSSSKPVLSKSNVCKQVFVVNIRAIWTAPAARIGFCFKQSAFTLVSVTNTSQISEIHSLSNRL